MKLREPEKQILDDFEHKVTGKIAKYGNEPDFPKFENYGITRMELDDYLFDKQSILDMGGSKRSQHLLGRAADIRVQGVSVEDVAAYAESLMPDWGGVGRYPVKAGRATGWVHVDTRADKARWRG